MVNFCVVNGCKRKCYPGCGISFHRIPANKERRALWSSAMNLSSKVPKCAYVCDLHFKEEDYVTAAKVTLKPHAVPSIISKNKVKSFKKMEVLPSGHVTTAVDIAHAEISGESGQKTSIKAKTKQNDSDSFLSDSDTPRARKLKEDIIRLRKKSKEGGIKIKCLQNKIRRILRKQGKGKSKEQVLKYRRKGPSEDESTDSMESSPESPSLVFIDKINFEEEKVDDSKAELTNNESFLRPWTPTALTDPDAVENIKLELEDDPLTTFSE